VFAVQAEVAEHIAMAMQVQLLPDERVRIENRPTESTEAYQHYLHALSLPAPFFFSTVYARIHRVARPGDRGRSAIC